MKFKLPKSLAKCADLLYETRAARLELQKQVDELKKNEAELKDHLINSLPKSDASGVSGKVANAKITKKTIPQVEDWEAVQKYIKRTNAFDLLQRRLSAPAVTERWDAGKTVPGVTKFIAVDVSCTKV